MIKTYYNTKINKDFLTDIAELYSNTEDRITIYLCSPGGSEWIADAALDIINTNQDQTELIGFGELMSAGFYIMMEAKCDKMILPKTYGMYHQPRYSIDIGSGKDPYYGIDTFMMKQRLNDDHKINIEKIKAYGFSPDEIKKYNKTEDVYFNHKRFIELLQNYNP